MPGNTKLDEFSTSRVNLYNRLFQNIYDAEMMMKGQQPRAIFRPVLETATATPEDQMLKVGSADAQVLSTVRGMEAFREYSEDMHCQENILFWMDVQRFKGEPRPENLKPALATRLTPASSVSTTHTSKKARPTQSTSTRQRCVTSNLKAKGAAGGQREPG